METVDAVFDKSIPLARSICGDEPMPTPDWNELNEVNIQGFQLLGDRIGIRSYDLAKFFNVTHGRIIRMIKHNFPYLPEVDGYYVLDWPAASDLAWEFSNSRKYIKRKIRMFDAYVQARNIAGAII